MTRYLLIATLALGSVACTRSQRAEMREDGDQTRARTETQLDAWEAERRDQTRRMEERLDRIDREIEANRRGLEQLVAGRDP